MHHDNYIYCKYGEYLNDQAMFNTFNDVMMMHSIHFRNDLFIEFIQTIWNLAHAETIVKID